MTTIVCPDCGMSTWDKDFGCRLPGCENYGVLVGHAEPVRQPCERHGRYPCWSCVHWIEDETGMTCTARYEDDEPDDQRTHTCDMPADHLGKHRCPLCGGEWESPARQRTNGPRSAT